MDDQVRFLDHDAWCRLMQGDWPPPGVDEEAWQRKRERDEAEAMRLLQEAAQIRDSIEFRVEPNRVIGTFEP